MSDVGQVTAGPSGNEATIAAMADILAAIGSGGGIVEWANEDPVPPAPAGQPVPASGATVGHGAIRLLDPSDPRGAAAGPAVADPADDVAPDARPREVVGHGTIKLRDRPAPADGASAAPEAAPKEAVGHGSIRLLDSAGPELPDMTPIATADILDALDSASPE